LTWNETTDKSILDGQNLKFIDPIDVGIIQETGCKDSGSAVVAGFQTGPIELAGKLPGDAGLEKSISQYSQVISGEIKGNIIWHYREESG
jgi:hypothetical protein